MRLADAGERLLKAPVGREQRRIAAVGVDVVRIHLQRLSIVAFGGGPVVFIEFQNVGEGGVRFGEIAVDCEGPHGALLSLGHGFGRRHQVEEAQEAVGIRQSGVG